MQDHHCLDCGRFLTETDAPDGTRLRLFCKDCGKWKRLILGPATRGAGRRQHAAREAVARDLLVALH